MSPPSSGRCTRFPSPPLSSPSRMIASASGCSWPASLRPCCCSWRRCSSGPARPRRPPRGCRGSSRSARRQARRDRLGGSRRRPRAGSSRAEARAPQPDAWARRHRRAPHRFRSRRRRGRDPVLPEPPCPAGPTRRRGRLDPRRRGRLVAGVTPGALPVASHDCSRLIAGGIAGPCRVAQLSCVRGVLGVWCWCLGLVWRSVVGGCSGFGLVVVEGEL